MRTTLTLDDDVAAVVERLRKTRRQSLKRVINDTLRAGLKQTAAPNPKRRAFRTGSVDLGNCLLGNVDSVADVLAVTESDSFK